MNYSVNTLTRKKVAVVGGGAAGMAALWALNRTYHDVYLFESDDRLGGLSNTVEWRNGKFSTAVDTGFVALNDATYRELSPKPAQVHVSSYGLLIC